MIDWFDIFGRQAELNGYLKNEKKTSKNFFFFFYFHEKYFLRNQLKILSKVIRS